MPTYHPSYLLRNEFAKKDAWEDFKNIAAKLDDFEGGVI
jgi:uracil-DNA glycosylase